MKKKKKILVAPLNWGLGHATRCVPVIRCLLAKGAEVVIGADGMALAYLQQEFPQIEAIRVPDLKVRYPKSGGFLLYFALRLPQLFAHVKKENRLLRKIVREQKFDGIISDNRYGLYHKNKPSVIISHQLFVETPAFKKTVHALVKKMNRRFSACWVPDVEGESNLSGRLSHRERKFSERVKYIGNLSRFTVPKGRQEVQRKIIVVLSGPEPFRNQLEELLLTSLKKLNFKALIVRGVVESEQVKTESFENLEVVNYLTSNELEKEIVASEIVIARSGYSTIMDLVALQQKAILIPTPGQTEQEYLANHLSDSNLFVFENQAEFDFEKTIQAVEKLKGEGFKVEGLDKKVIQEFLDHC